MFDRARIPLSLLMNWRMFAQIGHPCSLAITRCLWVRGWEESGKGGKVREKKEGEEMVAGKL